MKAKYMFGDIMDRKCTRTSISGTTCEGVTVSIKRGDVDVYTAGFPCTPWWSDPNARPLLKIRKKNLRLAAAAGHIGERAQGIGQRRALRSQAVPGRTPELPHLDQPPSITPFLRGAPTS